MTGFGWIWAGVRLAKPGKLSFMVLFFGAAWGSIHLYIFAVSTFFNSHPVFLIRMNVKKTMKGLDLLRASHDL